jgi:hypothetical protein
MSQRRLPRLPGKSSSPWPLQAFAERTFTLTNGRRATRAWRRRCPLRCATSLRERLQRLGPASQACSKACWAQFARPSFAESNACRVCDPDHCSNRRGIGVTRDGGLAKRVRVPAQNCVVVPEGLDPEVAALTEPIEGARYYHQSADPHILARPRRLESVCARHGVRLAAAASQFPLPHPAVASVVVGHESPHEVERNLRLLRDPIPPALWSEMKSEGLLPDNAPVTG